MPFRRVIGVLAHSECAEVDERGGVIAGDGRWRLDWWIGDAAGRWRDPTSDPSVRQSSLGGAPVVETSMRVGSGDVRHRAYAVVDAGTLAIVEVENETAEPVAFACVMSDGGPPVLSLRTLAPPPPDAPAVLTRAQVVAVPHRSLVRVGVPLSPEVVAWPSSVPSAAQVAAGWRTVGEHGERVEGPGTMPSQLAAARAQLLLTRSHVPAAWLLSTGARWRLARQSVDASVIEASPSDVARAAQRVIDRARRGVSVVDRHALVEAKHLLAALGDERAAGDVDRALQRLPCTVVDDRDADDRDGDDPIAFVARIREGLAREVPGGEREIAVHADVPADWQRVDVAVHNVPTRWGEISYAVRWHGARAALLWECEEPVVLRAPTLDASWRSASQSGEALLAGVSAT